MKKLILITIITATTGILAAPKKQEVKTVATVDLKTTESFKRDIGSAD